eukprot:COSAG06_NODE_47847_length_336_cov_0.970464_1_plen_50_part_10
MPSALLLRSAARQLALRRCPAAAVATASAVAASCISAGVGRCDGEEPART